MKLRRLTIIQRDDAGNGTVEEMKLETSHRMVYIGQRQKHTNGQ